MQPVKQGRLTAALNYKPTPSDIHTGSLLQIALQQVTQAPDHETRKAAWERYALLHAVRSPAMVEHMEAQQGILNGKD